LGLIGLGLIGLGLIGLGLVGQYQLRLAGTEHLEPLSNF
jgi:hypothetical protein